MPHKNSRKNPHKNTLDFLLTDFAMNFLTGIKKSIGTQALYYDDNDVNMIDVPVAGFPIVREKGTIPYNHFETEYEKNSTTIETSDIYGHFEASFTMSIGGSWKAVKAEVSTTTKVEANYKRSTEVKEEIRQKGTIGDVVIKELILGMTLRLQRVYEHSVHVYLNDEAKGNSLTWDGPSSWGDLWVASNALPNVEFLQFHPMSMTGTVHSSSLFLQAPPVFNAERHLDNLHLVLSCKGWTDWYVYNGGVKTAYPIGAGRTETLPVPGKQPLVTFIAAGDRSGVEQ
ncbi:hypothetical protein EC957_008102 [Mortierella hygrophila]|uniref:Uncharacterized protein n=1 Tax=Mortierella hygrophila TaxID=979708 RepID=A0A9P6JYB5_9FUNG|nr:hypothetical protein EC957_008102 [Mortierella hygrophila]